MDSVRTPNAGLDYARHLACGAEVEWRRIGGEDTALALYCPRCAAVVDRESLTVRGPHVAAEVST